MSAARLPLPYRDSCAHLLIPLNRCRHEEYYLPWKCEVRQQMWGDGGLREANACTERAPFVRKVPVRRVQGAREEDGRAEGRQGRRAKQLSSVLVTTKTTENAACIYSTANSIQFQPLLWLPHALLVGTSRGEAFEFCVPYGMFAYDQATDRAKFAHI
jgi:hypothetical protein